MNIELRPAETISIDETNPIVTSVNDNFDRKHITARLQGMYRDIVLWTGEEEYTLAGTWTNESVVARVKALLLANTITLN